MSQFSQHVKESFTEIFTDQFEHVVCWLTFIFTIVFGAALLVAPIIACCKYNWSNYWFLTYIDSVPLMAILITFTANWMCKLLNE